MIRLLVALALVAPVAHAQQTLSNLRDRNRVLLIFAPNTLDARFTQQLNAFEHHEAELRERDVAVIPLLQQPGTSSFRNLQPLLVQADEQIVIRRRFHIAPRDFVVILIGKDGTEKLRSHVPLSTARLNRTTDAMPGRRDEIKQRQKIPHDMGG